MYRRLLLSLYQSRNRAIHAHHEACVLSTKCDNVSLPFFRAANGGGFKAFGTSAISHCENKEGELPPKEGIKKDAKKDGDFKEAVNVGEEKGIELHEDVKMMTKQGEQRIEANMGGENVAQQRDEVNMEVVREEKIEEIKMKTEEVVQTLEVKMERDLVGEESVEINKVEQREGEHAEGEQVKSGKESLLDLLGAMKVEVTNKRKFKALKVQRSSEPVARPTPEAMESTISMFQKATADTPTPSETLNPELVAAASAAASTLPNQSQAESELLRQLRQHEAVAEAQKKGEVNNIGDIIADMKVGKTPNGRQNTRPANQIRFDEDGRGYTNERGITGELDGVRRRRSLFSGKRLSIFSPSTEQDEADTDIAAPTLWDIELAHQVAVSTNQMPRNGFEEMIQWTKEGKLWQYPVNNEAGLEEEASVPFHEHVFLEKHLEEGFPRQGPVRHFMELVVAGLANNPHLTVVQKKEHIAWFRDYFLQKEDVLKEAEVYLN